jgi:catechol-2,3-dioxygenase
VGLDNRDAKQLNVYGAGQYWKYLREKTWLKSFHHTGFVVRDLDTSAAFYSEVMGLEETTRMEVDGEFPERVVGLKGAHLKVALLNMGNGHILELVQYF